MSIGVIGTKSGMTRVFDEAGKSTPVSVIAVEANRVTQIKKESIDGYDAVQVTTGKVKPNNVSKPMAGHFAKAETGAGRGLWEFRIDDEETELTVGTEIAVSNFYAGQIVDVIGISKGKGYAGVIKRWNFRGQDNTHGNSISHRAPGSIGQCQTPGRVFKGKKMSGHMGATRVTTQNLIVVRVDEERGLILIKGAVPGPAGGDIIVRPAVKAGEQSRPPVEEEASS